MAESEPRMRECRDMMAEIEPRIRECRDGMTGRESRMNDPVKENHMVITMRSQLIMICKLDIKESRYVTKDHSTEYY